MKTDRLYEIIGVLTRREVEARILLPVVEAFASEFGREKVLKVLSATIVGIARQQGEQLRRAMGGDAISHFADSMAAWKRDNALEIEVLEQSEAVFNFNVTRCRYADMYRDLGIPELGAVLSCDRDFALVEGFNPRITLSRSQTIMTGAPCCDFRYRLNPGHK